MGRNVIVLLLVTAVLLVFFFVGTVTVPRLPELRLDESLVVGTVESIQGNTCRLRVTQGDSHFDGPTETREGDLIQVQFSAVSGGKTVAQGSEIQVPYRYTSDVSEYNALSLITVEQVSVLHAEEGR